MEREIKILHLEDVPFEAELIAGELKRGKINCEILVVNSKKRFTRALKDFSPDIILSDHSLPSFSSHEALKLVLEAGITVPFILITGTMSDEFAVKIIKEGAHDYVIKDRLQRLPSAVINAIEKQRLKEKKDAELQKANEDTKRLTTRLQLATRSAGMGIWDWDIKKNYLAWDDVMYQLYNIDSFQFGSIYDGWIRRLHPDDRQRVNEEIQMAVTNKKRYDTEFRIIWSDASIHTIKATGIIEKDDEGNPTHMIGANWDVTEVKLAEIERIKMVSDLLLRNMELEQFAYIVSHNLRAPVANIIGASNVLNYPGLDENDKEILNRGINDSCTRLDNVVKDLNQILDIRGDTNEIKKIIRFSELVEDIKASVKNLIEKENIEIKYNFSAIDEFFTLKPYLYSVFYNLISNSVKYRRQLVPTVIEIKSSMAKNKIELLFTDNGMGIDLEKSGELVFGLYRRFHTNIEGKGMGLFMVKTQVEILGGKISIKSAENKGTEFKIEFEI